MWVCKMSCIQSRSLPNRLKAGAVKARGDTELCKKRLCWEWESWQSAWVPHIVWYNEWFISYSGMSPCYAIAYLHKMWFFHLHLSPKQWICGAVCLKTSLIWLINLHSELNFLHGQKSYFLLDCKSLFSFVVQSCAAISLKNNFFCFHFRLTAESYP